MVPISYKYRLVRKGFFNVWRPKNGVNLFFFQIDIQILFTVTNHNKPISQLNQNTINKIKDVLVNIKPKFSDKLFNFYEKMQISLFFGTFKLLFVILQKRYSVPMYIKKLPMLYGIKIQIFFQI